MLEKVDRGPSIMSEMRRLLVRVAIFAPVSMVRDQAVRAFDTGTPIARNRDRIDSIAIVSLVVFWELGQIYSLLQPFR